MKGTVGFACDSTAGQWEEVGEPPEIVLTADQPGEAEVRVTWEAELTLWENALSLRTEQEWGSGVTATRPGRAYLLVGNAERGAKEPGGRRVAGDAVVRREHGVCREAVPGKNAVPDA